MQSVYHIDAFVTVGEMFELNQSINTLMFHWQIIYSVDALI